MRSFNRTMGVMAGVFFLMIVISISVGTSYIESNNLNTRELWNQTTNLDYSDQWNYDGLFSGKKSSDYETLELTQTDTFPLKPEIFISSSIEKVTFIEEDRSDIQVDYSREYPDTSDYTVSYSAGASSNRISVTATLNSRGLSINRNYDGAIVIRIPNDYRFESITLDSSAAVIDEDGIYTNTDELTVIASLGDVSLKTEYPIDQLDVQCSMGSIDLKVNEAVDQIDIVCDLGEVNLNLDAEVGDLNVQNDMGDITVEASDRLGKVSLTSSIGSVNGEFRREVAGMTVSSDMGSIQMTFHRNDDMSIYADTDMGDVDSDFTRVDKSEGFTFTSSIGSIELVKK